MTESALPFPTLNVRFPLILTDSLPVSLIITAGNDNLIRIQPRYMNSKDAKKKKSSPVVTIDKHLGGITSLSVHASRQENSEKCRFGV